jgi:integrase
MTCGIQRLLSLLRRDRTRKAIQEMAGHASITTALNIYGHLMPALQQESASALKAIYRRAAGEERS